MKCPARRRPDSASSISLLLLALAAAQPNAAHQAAALSAQTAKGADDVPGELVLAQVSA
jgi:hypothetical protein